MMDKKELLHRLTLVSKFINDENNIREEIENYRSIIEQIYEILKNNDVEVKYLIERFNLEKYIEI